MEYKVGETEGPLFLARSEWGAKAWKLTVSASCTLTDKLSRLNKIGDTYVYCPHTLLRHEKVLRMHKMTDLQNAATAWINLILLFRIAECRIVQNAALLFC